MFSIIKLSYRFHLIPGNHLGITLRILLLSMGISQIPGNCILLKFGNMIASLMLNTCMDAAIDIVNYVCCVLITVSHVIWENTHSVTISCSYVILSVFVKVSSHNMIHTHAYIYIPYGGKLWRVEHWWIW